MSVWISTILEALGAIGELEWARGSGLVQEEDRGATYAPIFRWRFRVSDSQRDETIRHAVETYSGLVAWDVYRREKNWIIAPRKVRELRESRGYRTNEQAIKALAAEHPEYGRQANRDVQALVEWFREVFRLGDPGTNDG